jgi:hypothetical protein
MNFLNSGFWGMLMAFQSGLFRVSWKRNRWRTRPPGDWWNEEQKVSETSNIERRTLNVE